MTTHREERAELHQALKDFAASPRFNFLKILRVGPLLGDDAKTLGAVAEMTFEALVASLENNGSDLHQLNDAQERLLTAVLHALAEGEVAESEGAGQGGLMFDSPDETQGDTDEGTVETTFNSVQSELELRERVAGLKGHPDLASIKDLPVGRFWAEDAPRAPFEESLTIGQLLGLDLGVLAKKRSMTSIRMRALARALERALQSLEGELEMSVPEPSLGELPPQHAQPPQRKPLRHRWQGHYDECSPGEMALIESVIFIGSDDPLDADNIFGALHHFCSAFSVGEFISIMKGAPLSVSTQRKLSAWAHSGALRTIVPLVQMTLQGPGAHIIRFAKVIQGSGPMGSVFGIVATLIVRGLGASEVSLDGATCRDVWTRNPNLVSMIVKEARALSKISFPRALTSVCPDMDPFLHEWLQGIASPVKRGKKRHKRR